MLLLVCSCSARRFLLVRSCSYALTLLLVCSFSYALPLMLLLCPASPSYAFVVPSFSLVCHVAAMVVHVCLQGLLIASSSAAAGSLVLEATGCLSNAIYCPHGFPRFSAPVVVCWWCTSWCIQVIVLFLEALLSREACTVNGPAEWSRKSFMAESPRAQSTLEVLAGKVRPVMGFLRWSSSSGRLKPADQGFDGALRLLGLQCEDVTSL